MTLRFRTEVPKCLICGSLIPRRPEELDRTPSGIFAPERIVCDGRQVYADGQEMFRSDVARFGITPEGEPGEKSDVASRRRTAPLDGSLCFVVPAYRRVDLSKVCFGQMADALTTLRTAGLDAAIVVIADDDNLRAARERDFETIEHDNRRGLGSKWNAGFAWAHAEGFEHVAALGSDSWIEPSRYIDFELPPPGEMLCTRNYTAVHPSGLRQARLWIGYDAGIGTRVFSTAMLPVVGHDPIEPAAPSGCDTATLRSLQAHQSIAFTYTNLHPFEIVGFQSETQITPYSRLRTNWLREEIVGDAFEGLDEHFASEHIDAIRSYYDRAA